MEITLIRATKDTYLGGWDEMYDAEGNYIAPKHYIRTEEVILAFPADGDEELVRRILDNLYRNGFMVTEYTAPLILTEDDARAVDPALVEPPPLPDPEEDIQASDELAEPEEEELFPPEEDLPF